MLLFIRGAINVKEKKLLVSIKNNPKTVKFKDLHKILIDIGFRVTQPGKGSSHYTYHYDIFSLTVPCKKPYVKAIYVKQTLKILEKMGY